MPAVVIPDVYSLSIDWSFNNVPRMTNVLHFAQPGLVINQLAADTMAANVGAAFISSNWEDVVATSIGLERVRVRDLKVANQPEYIGIINDDGLDAGTAMPLQNSVVVTLRTALAGRSYRGRVYLGGLTEASNGANGAIGSTARTNADAFITAINANQAADGYGNLVVASRKLLDYTVVTGIEVRDDTWDTQRRRNRPTS